MGGMTCAPPKIRKRRPPSREINNNDKRSPTNVMRNGLGRKRGKFDTKIMECNLGHARRAQDMLYQTIRESGIALAVIAEPYSVPNTTNWVQDKSGRAAITWTPGLGSHGALLDRGDGYVAIEWAGIAVMGIYVSPNCGLEAFGDFLDEVGSCVRRCYLRQVMVLDDFNAHSTQWGNARTTPRGRWLSDWAAGNGLVLVNRGTAKTCVAWRGTSVVDLTWATPTLDRRIRNWHVAEGVETLSDHLYVHMELKIGGDNDIRTGTRKANKAFLAKPKSKKNRNKG
jgi:hypothetical protein